MSWTTEDHRRLLLEFTNWINNNVACEIDDCEIVRLGMGNGCERWVDEFLASRHAATPSKGE